MPDQNHLDFKPSAEIKLCQLIHSTDEPIVSIVRNETDVENPSVDSDINSVQEDLNNVASHVKLTCKRCFRFIYGETNLQNHLREEHDSETNEYE